VDTAPVISDLTLKAPPRAAAMVRNVAERRVAVSYALALTPLLGAVLAWAVSLHMIHTRGLGRYGLPPALPVIWYAALAVLIGGAVTAMWGMRPSVAMIVLYVLAIVVVLYATVPAITAVPHYPWAYKHIGVTRFIAAHGGVEYANGDIYHRWPGFFALAAVFSRLAGVDPLSYATWAEPFFALIDALLVGAIARSISRDIRVAGYAALVFTLGDWVGQAYFAPQAAAYTLAFVLMLVFLRSFAGAELTPKLRRLIERVARRGQPPVPFAAPLPWSRAASVATVLGLDAVIVATHQLTPYVVLLQLVGLTVIGVARARLLLVAMGALTLVYLLPNLGFIGHNFGLFTSLNPADNIQRASSTPVNLDWLDANAGPLLSVVLILLTLPLAVRLIRRGQGAKALPLMVLVTFPLGILFAQSYGGEASLRAFLFSSPWCAVLIALGVQTVVSARVRLAAGLAICLVFAYLFIPAFYGQEDLNIIPQSEVTASEYFNAHAPADALLMLAAPDFPTRFGATYTLSDSPNIMERAALRHTALGAQQIPQVIALIHRYSSSGFIAFSTTGYQYAEVHDLTPPGALENLERAVAASNYFRPWFATRDAHIYELVD
jgi:hypothetical protein